VKVVGLSPRDPATVNPADVDMRSGRIPDLLEDRPFYAPGMEVAGVLDEIGDGVDRQLGTQVMAIVATHRGSAYAGHVVVPETSVARIPSGTDCSSACTLL
jgi:NADPH2:quinone reductase